MLHKMYEIGIEESFPFWLLLFLRLCISDAVFVLLVVFVFVDVSVDCGSEWRRKAGCSSLISRYSGMYFVLFLHFLCRVLVTEPVCVSSMSVRSRV